MKCRTKEVLFLVYVTINQVTFDSLALCSVEHHLLYLF